MAAGVMRTAFVADTPIGSMTVVLGPAGVLATSSTEDPEGFAARMGASLEPRARIAVVARDELNAYFDRRLRRFETPVDLEAIGTGFSRRVLEAARTIPYGELRTYADVAGDAGNQRAARAAGGALSRCPIEVFVPCHRVVGVGPSLGGYGGHEDRRRFLLRLEGAIS